VDGGEKRACESHNETLLLSLNRLFFFKGTMDAGDWGWGCVCEMGAGIGDEVGMGMGGSGVSVGPSFPSFSF